MHVGEPGYGVAVANDSTYGHDITSTTDADGRPGTTIRMSLLRAPLYPDPESDQGWHHLAASLRVGADIPEAIAEGYRLNLPLRTVLGVGVSGASVSASGVNVSGVSAAGVGRSGEGASGLAPLLTVDNPAVIIEAVKLAEDRSGDVIVRLYEGHGSRARATITLDFPVADVTETDLLERPLADAGSGTRIRTGAGVGTGAGASMARDGDAIRLELRPFQLATLRLSRPR